MGLCNYRAITRVNVVKSNIFIAEAIRAKVYTVWPFVRYDGVLLLYFIVLILALKKKNPNKREQYQSSVRNTKKYFNLFEVENILSFSVDIYGFAFQRKSIMDFSEIFCLKKRAIDCK